MQRQKKKLLLGDLLGLLFTFFIFIVPFVFMLVTSLKDRREANLLRISWPKTLHLENYLEVIRENNYLLLKAFKNSMFLTAGSVLVLIAVCSMAGYVLQRRKDRRIRIMGNLILIGLMAPPAILPTIWVMQKIHLYSTMTGMILIETALQIPFSVMLYQGYVSTIPTELEEAGYMDGCTRIQMFLHIVLPLLKPVTATVIILDAVSTFNDFTNPLYFLPGNKYATVQLTLYNFTGQYASSYNLLFSDVIIITIPMLILFLIFNKRIVEGMVAGAVKG